ncbi:MAG: tetratricopeptide repeat protein [Rhodospirillaceae bacterium]
MDISILDGASDGPGLGTLLEQARASVRGGRPSEARRTCETLVETHPEQPDGWYLLGMTALRDGELDTAHTHLSRAVEMRRGYAPYRVALGQALRKLDDPEGAERQFREAWTLDPSSHEAAFGLAITLATRGQRSDAAQVSASSRARSAEAVV